MANPTRIMDSGENLKSEADEVSAAATVGTGKTPNMPQGDHAQLYRDACEHAPAVGIDGTKGATKMPVAKDGRRSWRGGK